MKIALYTDLHNEFGPPWVPPRGGEDADVVVLAGDIGSHTDGLVWAAKVFPLTPIIYVAGNHEYYGAHLGLLDELRRSAKLLDIHFLERDAVEICGVRFLGCTLWSGFNLYGEGAQQTLAMRAARRTINDFSMISARGAKTLKPKDTLAMHRTAVAWLDAELTTAYRGKTVVVTHFAPHRVSVAPAHQGSEVSPYFVTDLSWLMKKHRIELWCHGHTHTNNDVIVDNDCRLVSNQMGYPGERSRTYGELTFDSGFRRELMIYI